MRTCILVLIFSVLLTSVLLAETMIIKLKNGKVYNLETSQIQSLTFSGSSMMGFDENNSSNSGKPMYVGCYRDYQGGVRVLNGYTFVSGSMTTQKCLSTCGDKGYTYAATQYSSHCFCGNTYDSQGSANNCNMKCSGNANETCGGHSANSVYRVNR